MDFKWPKIIRDPVHNVIRFENNPADRLLLDLINSIAAPSNTIANGAIAFLEPTAIDRLYRRSGDAGSHPPAVRPRAT